MVEKKGRRVTKEATQNGYIRSVNRALDYIDTHYAEELSLEILANEACFSPCHFHRVFKGIIGETHQEYINRIRLEKAALLMDKSLSITEIAMAVGFSSPAHFAQSFRARYQVSPKAFRVGRRGRISARTSASLAREPDSTDATKTEIKTFPPCRIAYVRHFGGYDFRIGLAWKTLFSWARKHDALGPESLRISCSYDDPSLTPEGKLRYDACVSISEGIEGEGPVSVRTIEGGPFAVFPFEGRQGELASFYDRVYGKLLPASDLRLRDFIGYRVHRESAAEQIRGHCRQELRVPLA